MPKNQMNDENLLKKPEYKSIMYLIETFQYQDYERVGLTAGQLLYALRKRNGNFVPDPEIEEFFTRYNPLDKKNEDLEYMSSNKTLSSGNVFKRNIEIGCIKNSVQLNERLNMLIDRGWVTTLEGTKPRYYRYITTNKWMADKKTRQIRNYIEFWKPDNITDKLMLNILLGKKLKLDLELEGSFVLFGFPHEEIKKLNANEKKNLEKWINNAVSNIYKIMDLKYKKMKLPCDEWVKRDNKDYRFETISFHCSCFKSIGI